MAKLIGVSRTKELVYSARLLNAVEAFDLGIVNQLASSSCSPNMTAALSEAAIMAEKMAENGPLALRAAKVAIDRGHMMDTESALDWERACYERCIGSKDRLEGLAAFAEKRKPRYTGE